MDTLAPAAIGDNSGIPAYKPLRLKLAELKKEADAAAFDYESAKGNKEARSYIYKLRQEKAAVDKVRKKEKAESLEYGRRVDEQAKEIIAEYEAMIDTHNKPLEEIEARERQRVEQLKTRIVRMQELCQKADPFGGAYNSTVLKANLETLTATAIDDTFAEFLTEAAKIKDAGLADLARFIAEAETRESEAAELDRLRREAEERKRLDREEEIRKEAGRKAEAEAERKAAAERERVASEASREREAAEKRELELKLAAERSERQKVEAEQRAVNAQKEAEAKLAREAEEKAKREAAELAAREADKKHRAAINSAAVAALVKGGMGEADAKLAVTLIAKKTIPAVSISY